MTSHDPNARRDTPLALKLKERIEASGPMTVCEFMQACLQDDDHGYYTSRQAIGQSGDFITSPEISQTFGELIGLWAAVVWQQMGSPSSFNFIELGPGRGTLMADALRATSRLSGFLDAANVRLVEINPLLRVQQKERITPLLPDITRLHWHTEILETAGDNAPHLPSIVIANEFLDTFAPTQFVRKGPGWVWRRVACDEGGRLEFTDGPQRVEDENPELAALLSADHPAASDGEIAERTPFALVPRCLPPKGPLAALLIDYGHTEPGLGDTLQAVRNHAPEHPLTSPGEADLTVQVDFPQFAGEVLQTRKDLSVDGPIAQAEFLGRLGILQRASRLMASNPAKAAEVEAGVLRLMSPQGMGTRFKAIGVRSKELPTLPGFE